ncbi:restriction endonuclease subunit S [Proteus mirabilis]|uniref:restriction endonuclease subunit S n=1 Tax=Proteus mirabilis TaxID=584 RepID=UPI0029E232A9|nr:restriction endonuclease subunit S [Proteus mirabilis]
MTNFSGENLNAACGGMDSRRNGVAEVSTKYLVEAAKNAVPAGYKQTELGVIPEDWECIPSKEIVSYLGGFAFSSKAATTDGIRWLKIANVGLNEVKWDAESYLPASYSQVHQEYLLRESDVVMALTRPILGESLKVAILNETDAPALLNQRVAKLVPKNAGDQRFLYYLVQTSNFIAAMNLAMAGSDPPNIGTRALGDISVQVPKLPKEQTAIANALSDVDALISELEKLIAKKQAIKTATMQQLLTGRTRLPQFALREDGTPTNSSGTNLDAGTGGPKGEGQDGLRKSTKQSELGEIPEDWEIVCFDQLKDKKDNWAITGGPFGSNLKASDYTENGVRVIQLQNIGDGVFKNDDFVYTSYKKANELISCNIYPDEIILSKMGDPVARACLIPHFHSRYVMCSDGIRLKVDSQRYSEKFVFYFLNYPLFRNQALDASTGSTRKRIGLSELRDLLLFAPPKEEQTAIATILSDMDAEIQALEQRLSKTRQIKQGMMQELLTGKTRLPIT